MLTCLAVAAAAEAPTEAKRAAAGIFFSIFTTFLVWADYHFAGTRGSSEQVQ